MPWFVDWDDYKTNFEQEASRILGHPVTVNGSADASILPSPSLTFTDVRVGPLDQPAMMTVDRFEVTIELMPLLQGEIRVTSMRMDRPNISIGVDAAGEVDWLKRAGLTETFNPDKIALSDVTISNGTMSYADARTGVALDFNGVTASVEARSLAGPWRVDGSYLSDGTAVPFHFATGRRLDDGTIRLTSAVSPAQWPVDVTADGVVAFSHDSGVSYIGTYAVTELVENVTGEATPEGTDATPVGWRSEGAFTLTGEQVAIDKAVLSHGPADRPTSVAGGLTLTFGDAPSFDGRAEARQLDLDRAFGGGPNEPLKVSAAVDHLVAWLAGIPVPPIPGSIAVDVPAIVVGGSVIQDVAFAAAPAENGWRIDGLRARLPGQAIVSADGVLSTIRTPGFAGFARLAVAQPATFASWWRGGGNQGAGRLLSAFDISGRAEISPGRISVDDIQAQIGAATISGRFAWTERSGRRHLGTDLTADRIDFAEVKALTELLVGRNLTTASVLADSYSVIVSTGAFDFEDIHMSDVAVNAEYSDDVLKIVRFAVDDLGGSSFRITSGRIDDLTNNPRGELTAELEAQNIDGLALIAGRLFPGSGLFEWLGRTGRAITPAFVTTRIVAPPSPGGTGIKVEISDGVAGATTFGLNFESSAPRIANWRNEQAKFSLVLDSPDSAALATQFGLRASAVDTDTGSHIEIDGSGIPASGMNATVIADAAGITMNANGSLRVEETLLPAFAGNFGISTENARTLLTGLGLSIPGALTDASVDLDGTVNVLEGRATLGWQNALVAGRSVSGKVEIARAGAQAWRVDGNVAIDDVELGWLLALGLGSSPFPGDGDDAPWSKEPFRAPAYGPLTGKIAATTERLHIGADNTIANAELALTLQPQRVDVDLLAGHIAGGRATGGVSIHNVEGNANVTGQFALSGVFVDSFVWRLDERAVANGIAELSANFEATGRSPAGLISSMTGGGVIAISEGEARYADPTSAARQIIRASDLGQEFTEDGLRLALADQIDGGTLAFGETGGAFTIAAGSVRLRGLAVKSPDDVEGTGNAVVDLNSMRLDSDWTLSFDPGDTVVPQRPSIGLVFRGPVARPTRTIDPLPFDSYLNTRREARILEIIAQEEADRAEREWFARVALKLRQDAERAERLAREAAEAEERRRAIEADAGARLAALHVFRETRAEQLLAEGARRWHDRAVAAREEAAAMAASAADTAATAQEQADIAAAALLEAMSADEEAATQLAAAQAEVSSAEVTATTAASQRDQTAAAAVAAETAASAVEEAFAAATAASGESETARQAALKARDKTAAMVESAAAAATVAEQEAATAADELASATAAAEEAARTVEQANAALQAAEAALSDAEAAAQTSGAEKTTAARTATAAIAQENQLRDAARVAAEFAANAEAARAVAEQAVDGGMAALAESKTAFDQAQLLAANARSVAEALAEDASADSDAVASAQEIARAMELRHATRRADVDRLTQVLEQARIDLTRSQTAAEAARSRAMAAEAALADASKAAAVAREAARQADAGNASRLNVLADLRTARDSAAEKAASAAATAQAAAAAFNAAQTHARELEDAAMQARAAATAATQASHAASAALAAAVENANTDSAAVENAQTNRAEAVATLAEAQAEAVRAEDVATNAETALAAARSALDAATAGATEAQARRAEAEALATTAVSAAEEANTAAAAAAEAARQRAGEAEAAGARIAADGALVTGSAATAPRQESRPRRQPINLVPEAFAGDQPMVLVPQQ